MLLYSYDYGGYLKALLLILLSSVSLAQSNPSIFLITNYMQTYTGTAFELLYKGKKVTITNAHVCGHETFLVALLTNPTRFKILLVEKVYRKHDLCMLSPVSSLQPLELADDYLPDDYAVIEGFPYGVHAISIGKTGKMVGGNDDRIYVVFKGSVYPGNSGSPVQNRYNKVIGVLAIGDSVNFSYGGFVPLEYLKDFIDNACNK